METIAIALSVSVLVVLVLLMSCWNVKPRKKSSCDASRQEVKEGFDNEQGSQFSDWGSGEKNKQEATRYKQLQDLEEYDDYSSVAQYTALEPEVFKSHQEYAEDLNHSTSGASNQTVRSDPNDVVPWMGLRRVNYHDVYAGNDARVEHSEYVDQLPVQTKYML